MSKDLDEGVDISVQLRHVCLEYPFKSLQAATRNFHQSNTLGEGSAGTVFKAEMQDGSYAAVKVIDLAVLGDNALVAGFEEEVMILSKFRHPNVVVLMGWARESSRRFLIYEFLGGGDVFGRLQKCKDGRSPFLWYERLAVCRDAAMGLAHLHNATPHAFHRDVKTANILLGPSGAKIADFGLSVVGKTRTQSTIDCEFPSGTPGYTCPTYIQTGKMTEASEVYSFGMVLLEVLLNMMPAGLIGEEFVYPIQECIQPTSPGAVERGAAAADAAAGWPPQVAREVAALGLACTDADDARRPSFNDICRALRFLQDCNPPTCIMQPQAPAAAMRPPGVPLQTGALNVSLPPGQAFATNFGLRPQVPMPGPPGIGFAPPPGPGGLIQVSGPPWQMGPGRPAFPHTAHLRAPHGVPPGQPVPVVLVQQVPTGAPHIAVGPGRPPPHPQQRPAMVQRPVAGRSNVVEAALEVAHVHGLELSKLSPEVRMLPLLAGVDPGGRRVVVIGRQHQPQWFEVLLSPSDLSCISRDAFELSWGGPDIAQAALSLRVLGSNIVLVDDAVAQQGVPIRLNPGSRITFAFQGNASNPGLFIILAVLVHCAPQLAAPGPGLRPPGQPPPAGCPTALTGRPPFPGAYAGNSPPLPKPGAVQVPVVVEDSMALQTIQEGAWLFECIYAAGLGPEGLWAVPPTLRNLSFQVTADSSENIIGRAFHSQLFEALLSHEPSLLSCISRSHIQLEAKKSTVVAIDSLAGDETQALLVTNLSTNPVVANRVNLKPTMKALYQNESAEVHDGDTLSFACEQQPTGQQADESPDTKTTRPSSASASAIGTTVLGLDRGEAGGSLVPFLTLRVSAPPAPPPPSPFVMMSPMSAISVETCDPEAENSMEASTLNASATEFVPAHLRDKSIQEVGWPTPVEEVNRPIAEERNPSPPRMSAAQSEAGYGLRRSAPVIGTSEFPNPSAESPQHRCVGDFGAPSPISSTVPIINRHPASKAAAKAKSASTDACNLS